MQEKKLKEKKDLKQKQSQAIPSSSLKGKYGGAPPITITTNMIHHHHPTSLPMKQMQRWPWCCSNERRRRRRIKKKMSPDAFAYHPSVPCRPHSLHPLSLKKQLDLPPCCKYNKGLKRMKFIGKGSIAVLLFTLSIISILRFLWITISASSASRPLPALHHTPLHTCSSASPTCRETTSRAAGAWRNQHHSPGLTEKEFQLLSNIISQRAPCNLLIFGLEQKLLKLSALNAGGITVFLEDDPAKLRTVKRISNTTRMYKVEHQIPAREAYRLLKHARGDPACAPHSKSLEESTCQLALTKLPQEVYELEWDVVVVDGPSGDKAEAPGRMAAIYTASMIARAGNITNVVVHDTDRTIEKWFSWEYLCDENLVSSKGKLWNFRLIGKSNSTRFCP